MQVHNGGYEICYNVQTSVDESSHIIIDFEVTNKCNDSGLLLAEAEKAKEQLGVETLDVVADKGFEGKEETLNCLKAGIFPTVGLKNNAKEVKIELEYKPAEINEEILNSTKSEDIEKCLHAGVLPAIYNNKKIEIEVTQENQDEDIVITNSGIFVLNEDGKSVTCPEGKILNKSCYLKNRCATRYMCPQACSDCNNKCTISKYREVVLKEGQKTLTVKNSHVKHHKYPKSPKVTVKLIPDKGKMKKRKCIVEHPFGTIKRWCNGSYVLLKGIPKATADLAMSFLVYNMKRAINMLGFDRLIAILV